jgi:CheY-like chemotaxis protein
VKKILIVSSSKSFLERSKNLLTGKDFQVNIAQSGAEALQLQKEYSFNLILSDMHLQDMGGDTLCSTIRNTDITKKTIIILICYDNADEHERVVKSGAVAKFIRPVQPEQIIEYADRQT